MCTSRFDVLRSAVTRVEVLYFEGCPTYREAETTLRGALAEEGIEAGAELIAVNTDEEAQDLRFPGSPTVTVDGRDLFPVPEQAEYALGCKTYATPEGLRGSPTAEMLKEALTKKGAARAEDGL